MNSFKKSYPRLANKRILVTGATGFIGNHVFKALESVSSQVFGLSRSPQQKQTLYSIDVENFDQFNAFVAEHQIDVIFHLAGKSLVEAGQTVPYETIESNIIGTLNVLESARVNQLQKVVISSTSHVYGEKQPPYTEEDIPQLSRPYETSKLCADLIAQSYAKTFQLPVYIPRFVNVYGPGDINFSRLIPATMKQVVASNNPPMWGGSAVRDYLFVSDAVTAYLELGDKPFSVANDNLIYNFGADNLISVQAMIEKIIAVSGKNLQIQKIAQKREDEISEQHVSWEKAKESLGWTPEVSLDEGLRLTYEWYQRYFQEEAT